MTEIEIIDPNKNYDDWNKYFDFFPNIMNDVYFSPDYLSMHNFINESKVLMYVYKENDKKWIYPFLLQPINDFNSSVKYYDIESAYGYGGPLSNIKDKEFLDNANTAFSNWCSDTNVIAEFVRFHPILENYKFFGNKINTFFNRETVSLDLNNFDIKNLPFDAKVRNMIKRPFKENVEISQCSINSYYNDFIKLYKKNMVRLNADSYYFFNDNYFINLKNLISKQGFFIGAILNENLVGGAIFLNGKRIFHYHLSAIDRDCHIPGLTNAIIFEAIKIALDKKIEFIHLGGGNSNDKDDFLFKFKKKMGNKINKFYIGTRIHNEKVYNKIKDRWSQKYPVKIQKYKNRILCYRF